MRHALLFRLMALAGPLLLLGCVGETKPAAPSAPQSVVAVAGNRKAVVAWTAPASENGSPITSYTVTSNPGGGSVTTTGALSATVTGLTNGTSYTFTVTATNAIGEGPASAASNAVVPASVHGAPTAARATSAASGASAGAAAKGLMVGLGGRAIVLAVKLGIGGLTGAQLQERFGAPREVIVERRIEVPVPAPVVPLPAAPDLPAAEPGPQLAPPSTQAAPSPKPPAPPSTDRPRAPQATRAPVEVERLII